MKIELTEKQICDIIKDTDVEILCKCFRKDPYKFMNLFKIMVTDYFNRRDLILAYKYILDGVPIQTELF